MRPFERRVSAMRAKMPPHRSPHVPAGGGSAPSHIDPHAHCACIEGFASIAIIMQLMCVSPEFLPNGVHGCMVRWGAGAGGCASPIEWAPPEIQGHWWARSYLCLLGMEQQSLGSAVEAFRQALAPNGSTCASCVVGPRGNTAPQGQKCNLGSIVVAF